MGTFGTLLGPGFFNLGTALGTAMDGTGPTGLGSSRSLGISLDWSGNWSNSGSGHPKSGGGEFQEGLTNCRFRCKSCPSTSTV